MKNNPFNENPYEVFAPRFKEVARLKSEAEKQITKLQDEFLKVFIPDRTQFDELKDKAKEAQKLKKPVQELDKIYYDMAMIYKRWLPLEEELVAANPLYADLFKGLKMILRDIDKAQKKDSDERENNAEPRTTRRNKKTV